MRLAESGRCVDEQRVVGLGRRLGDSHCRSVGEAVGRTDDERLEGVLRIQPVAALAYRPDAILAMVQTDVTTSRRVVSERSSWSALRGAVMSRHRDHRHYGGGGVQHVWLGYLVGRPDRYRDLHGPAEAARQDFRDRGPQL